MLNRMRVKPTRNSKKIRRKDGNKSDSPHLRGKSSCCRELTRRWSIKERKLKLQSFNFVFCRTWQLGRVYILYTGRAPAAARGPATGTDAEGFFSWNWDVYPHLDQTPAQFCRHYAVSQQLRNVTLRVCIVRQLLRSHCAYGAQPLSSGCAELRSSAQLLRSGCAAIAQWVRSHCAVGAQQLCSGAKPLRSHCASQLAHSAALRSACAAIAQWVRTIAQ